MNSYYYEELPVDISEGAALAIAGVFLGILAVVALVALVLWVLRSSALHKIAKRRGIRHAWLAWIPLGGSWILGSVSDQYQHLVRGKVTSRRKILLLLSLVSMFLGLGNGIVTIVQAIMAQTDVMAVAWAFATMSSSLLVWACGLATLVFNHICNYDLYRSCNPQTSVVFLVLGIVIPITEPFFYFVNRKKDLGMVKPEPAPAAPAEPVELPTATPDF